MIDAALWLAGQGFAVFPLNGKVPHPATSGFKDATTDPDEVRAYWGKFPGSNIGIATGALSGCIVLDVDVADGKQGQQSLEALCAQYGGFELTWEALTGTGGRHIFFQHPGGVVKNSAGKIGAGLDVRGDGGYVVAAPSIHPVTGKAYGWVDNGAETIAPCPEWLLVLMRGSTSEQHDASSFGDRPPAEFPPADDEILARAMADLLRLVPPAIEGEGGQTKAVQAGRLLQNDWALRTEEAWPRLCAWNKLCLPPFDEESESGQDSLKMRVRPAYTAEYGWRRRRFETERAFGRLGIKKSARVTPTAPLPDSPEADGSTDEDAAFTEALEAARHALREYGVGNNARTTWQRLTKASGLFADELGEVSWLVDGLIPEGSVTMLCGGPKTTKTWLEMEIAQAVSTGTKVVGEFEVPKRGAVAMFLAEDSKRGARNRMRALAVTRGMSAEEATASVYAVYRARLRVDDDEDLARIIADVLCLPEEITALSFDPLIEMHTQDENSAAMGAVIARFRILRDILGVTIVFVHHSGKPNDMTGKVRGGDLARGHSSIFGSVDGLIQLRDPRDEAPHWWESTVETNSRDGGVAGKFTLRLDVDDNVKREAIKATWTFSRDIKNVKAESVADLAGRIEVWIRDSYRTALVAGSEPLWVTQAQLYKQFKGDKNNYPLAQDDLIKRGVAEKRPLKAGIRWIPNVAQVLVPDSQDGEKP